MRGRTEGRERVGRKDLSEANFAVMKIPYGLVNVEGQDGGGGKRTTSQESAPRRGEVRGESEGSEGWRLHCMPPHGNGSAEGEKGERAREVARSLRPKVSTEAKNVKAKGGASAAKKRGWGWRWKDKRRGQP